MSGGILDSFQTIIPTAAAVLSERRQMLRMTQQEVADADWWIRDFYDTAGGRQRDRASGTGGSNASAGMVHIK